MEIKIFRQMNTYLRRMSTVLWQRTLTLELIVYSSRRCSGNGGFFDVRHKWIHRNRKGGRDVASEVGIAAKFLVIPPEFLNQYSRIKRRLNSPLD